MRVYSLLFLLLEKCVKNGQNGQNRGKRVAVASFVSFYRLSLPVKER